MKRLLEGWIVLTAGLAVAVGTTGCSGSKAATTASSGVPAVAVAVIARGDVAQVLTIAAEFRPFQEIDVHSKVAGYLKSITVDVGDRVAAGQLLAVLEIPELENELQQDDGTIKRGEQEIKRAQADLDRTESGHDVAHLAAARLATVMKVRPNLVAQQDVDESLGRDRVAEAQVATGKAALAVAEQQLEIARATQNKTKTMLAYARITAPFAGVITHRYADMGSMIQAGTASQSQAMPVVKLSQNDRLRLVIPVPESAVSRIHTGALVELSVQSLHKTYTGRVARQTDRLDTDTRTMGVEVDVPNPRFEIVPGMYADVSLVLEEAKDVVVAPVQAIDRSEVKPRVVVVNHDRQVELRDVTLGLEAADRVEVKTGLQVDDQVVIGSRGLKAGTVVVPKRSAEAVATGGGTQ